MTTATSAPALGAGRIRIRLPIAEKSIGGGAPAFLLDAPLSGAKIGLRHEGSWRSWIFISGLWQRMLAAEGAHPLVVQTGERVGHEGESTAAAVAEWVEAVDAGVVGLGTCGSCTSWSVHDAVALEAAGKASVVVVTEEFATHARNMAAHLGHPDLKVLVLPHPLEARPESELRDIAAEHFPAFLDLIGAAR